MVNAVSEEELQLRKRARRRLIGAIVLVSAVAVFLPMVLDHEPKPLSQDISIQIPAPNNAGTFTSKIVPIAPGDAPTGGQPSTATPSAVVEKPTSQPDSTAKEPPAHDTEAAPPLRADAEKSATEPPKPVVKPIEKPRVKSPANPNDTKKAAAGGFVVQVVALNDAKKAKELQQKISGSGVKSYVEVVPTTKGNVTRVRAGPYATRAEAENISNKIKELGFGSNIIPK